MATTAAAAESGYLKAILFLAGDTIRLRSQS